MRVGPYHHRDVPYPLPPQHSVADELEFDESLESQWQASRQMQEHAKTLETEVRRLRLGWEGRFAGAEIIGRLEAGAMFARCAAVDMELRVRRFWVPGTG
jgi:hypothetical protein